MKIHNYVNKLLLIKQTLNILKDVLFMTKTIIVYSVNKIILFFRHQL